MAQKKISELAALNTLTDDDLVVVVNDPLGTPVTYKMTVANLKVAILGTDHNADGTHKAAVYDPGEIKETIRSVAPAGWLLCTGSGAAKTIGDATSGADYAGAQYQTLFGIIQTEGWATPTNTWALHGKIALPDFRDLVRVGVSGTKALAAVGGLATVTLSAAQSGISSHTHGASSGIESATHSHNDGGHAHTVRGTSGYWYTLRSGLDGSWGGSNQQATGDTMASQTGYANLGTQTANHTHAITVNNVADSAASQAHENMPPYKCTNVIIKY
jgi:microcystin-dependent protein